MNTVTKTLIESHWDQKYEVYELKQFKDERGMVCETFRLDDDLLKDAKMCYISETEPFVMRGPHEHGWFEKEENGVKVYGGQTDFFVSWKTQMVYQMYNKENNENRFFVTDPNKLYLVKVAPPIIHSYRNISMETSRTMNFPTSLFMGEGKKEEIDEIRHEPIVEDNKTVIIFGATGRLGKALVKECYDKMKYHYYDVIPLYNKVKNEKEVEDLFLKINKQNPKDVSFINCSGITNVQETKETSNLYWTNSELPYVFAKNCIKFGWKFIQFSSDYVFQTTNKYNVSLSPYTNSKKRMEQILNQNEKNIKDCLVFRVANLFSTEEDDLHNLIYKFWLKVKGKQKITVDPKTSIFPTDVKVLSEYIVDNYVLVDFDIKQNIKYINVANDDYKLKDFLIEYFDYDNIEEKEGLLEDWSKDFKNNSIKLKDSKNSIINIINRLKEN